MAKPLSWAVCLAVLGTAGVTVWSETSQADASRYKVILERNPFGLKPPVVAPGAGSAGAPTNAPAPVSNLKLAGISNGPDGKRAYLVSPPQPPKQTNTLYFTLQAGWEEQGVKVLEITDREVKVLNAGNPATLTFADNGFPTPTGPVAVPGKPMIPGAAVPAGQVPPPPQPQLRNPGIQPVLPVGGNAGGVGLPGSGSVQPMDSDAGGSRSLPTRNLRAVPSEADPDTRADILRRQEAYFRARGLPWPPQVPPLPGGQAGGGGPAGDE